jgi:hypothetical protein
MCLVHNCVLDAYWTVHLKTGQRKSWMNYDDDDDDDDDDAFERLVVMCAIGLWT